MNKYFTTLTNERGDVLPNYRAQVVDNTGAIVTIYSDKSGTRFTDASGNIINYATAEANGRVSFYFEAEEGQVLQTLDSAGSLVDSEPDFSDNLILANLPGNIAQDAVTDLPTDLAAKAATADLASGDAGKGAELVAIKQSGAGAVARTVADKFAEALSIKDFGAVGDDATDDTAAIQNAINAAATLGLPLYAPAGIYRFTNLYFYYDASLNPNYPSLVNNAGKCRFRGAGRMLYRDYNGGIFVNTVFRCTSATGGMKFGKEYTAFSGTQGLDVGDFSVVGATTGKLVDAPFCPQWTKFERIFVGNAANGTAFYVGDCWTSAFREIQVVGNGTGEGFVRETVNAGGGNNTFYNLTARNFATGIRMGKDYNGDNILVQGERMVDCQAHYCTDGVRFGYGVFGTSVEDLWLEVNTGCDVLISHSAENIRFINGLTSSVAEMTRGGNIICGDDSESTADERRCRNIEFDFFRWNQCRDGNGGLYVQDAAIDIRVKSSCSFKNNGGAACRIKATHKAELSVDPGVDYAPNGTATIPVGRRICTISGTTGAFSYTNATTFAHRCERRATVGGNLDCSTWRRPPEVVIFAGARTLTLPSSLAEWSGTVTVIQSNAAASTVDAGSGKTIKGVQTYTVTQYDAVSLRHRAAGDTVWDVTSSAIVDPTTIAAATYVAPSGGATVDAQARTALAQNATDIAAMRTALITAGVLK